MSARSNQSGEGGSSVKTGDDGGGEEGSPHGGPTAAPPVDPSHPPESGLKFIPSDAVVFKGPFNRPSRVSIQVVNNSEQAYVIKVMVTQPRRYLIRPNYALLEANSAVEVKAEMRPLPGPDALEQLLATRQKLLFKWRPLKKSPSEESSSSPASKKSTGGSAQENPSALFITCTTPITETGVYIHFEPPPATPTWDGTPAAKPATSASGAGSPTVGGRASSLAGAPGTAIEEESAPIWSLLSSRPGIIIITSMIVLLIAIAIAIAYVVYARRSGGGGSADHEEEGGFSQRFLRRYIF